MKGMYLNEIHIIDYSSLHCHMSQCTAMNKVNELIILHQLQYHYFSQYGGNHGNFSSKIPEFCCFIEGKTFIIIITDVAYLPFMPPTLFIINHK